MKCKITIIMQAIINSVVVYQPLSKLIKESTPNTTTESGVKVIAFGMLHRFSQPLGIELLKFY